MTMRSDVKERGRRSAGGDARRHVLADVPVEERRLQLAGVPTAVLEGGAGPPLVLLHGPATDGARHDIHIVTRRKP